jgi:UDP-N-acetylmuramoylalanine--D-glutamate ligase
MVNSTDLILLIDDAATASAQRLDEIVETTERAIFRTGQLAKQYQARVVLLSPGCAIMQLILEQP